MRHFRKVAVIALASWGVACSSPSSREGEPIAEQGKALTEPKAHAVQSIEQRFVKDRNVIKVTGRSFKIRKRQELPDTFGKSVTLSFRSPEEYSEIGRRIAAAGGIPITYTVDALLNIGSLGADTIDQRRTDIRSTQLAEATGEGLPGPAATPNQPVVIEPQTDLPDNAFPSFKIALTHSGTLKSVLDAYARESHLSWRWNEIDGVVELYKYDTQTFQIDTLPGTISHRGKLSTSVSSDEDGASTSSRYETEVAVETPEVWEVLEKGVRAVMSPGGELVISPLTGTVTVTDTPRTLREVESVVDEYNVRLAQTIMYKVDIVEVSQNNTDATSFSLANLLFRSTDGYTLDVATGLSVLPDEASSLVGGVIRPTSKFNGSQAVLNNLSQRADVVSHRTVYATSTNGVTTPVQEVREITFLASKSVSVTGDVIQTALEPGVTSEGFSIFLTGMLTSHGSLILQTSLDLATLEELVRRGNDDDFIQGPITQKKNALTRSNVRAGDTLLAALLERNVTSRDRNGIGHYKNIVTGGADTALTQKIITMVMVTPYFKA